MEKYILISLTVLIICPGNAICEEPADQTPLGVIRASNQKILDIYAAHEELDQDRKDEIDEVMNSVTDFDKIAHDTSSKFCENLTAEKCDAFNDVFKRLLRVSSLRKLGRYRADRFDYLEEQVEDDTAVVRTIAYYDEEEIELDYHLAYVDGAWMIVNYVSDGVDTIRNYRKQFTRILRKESIDQLIERLEKKIHEYENEASGPE
jgi:phospholipid transport system substrate-binding protein